jgi:hypothetical protein
MSDVDDVFLPKPNDLLVNLSECRTAVESLLGRLNDMFADNHTIGSALGPALQSGFKLIVCFLVVRHIARVHYVPSEPYWRQTCRFVLQSTEHRSRRSQEQGGSQDIGHSKGG